MPEKISMKPGLFIGILLSALVFIPGSSTLPGTANGQSTGKHDCRTTGCLNGECVAAGVVSRCVCYQGFILNPRDQSVCSDIDECKLAGGRICGYGRCVNRAGGWQCQCYPNSIPINQATYCKYSPWYAGPFGSPNVFDPYSLIMWSVFADNM